MNAVKTALSKIMLAAALLAGVGLSNTANAGAVGPQASHTDVVRPYATDVYHVRFYGDEIARVSVVGDGDSDLDLYIYDENGNLMDKDDDSTDTCYTAWEPRWTGQFRIEVVNRGGQYNRYCIRTN